MFYHTFNPVLFHLGPFEIRYYGIAYIIGFLAAYYVLKQAAKYRWVKNFENDAPDNLLTYLLLGLIIGARLGDFLIYNPSTLIYNPLEVLMIWHGGMSFHGGLIGVVIATLLYCRKYKVKFYNLADILIFPALIGMFLTRIANFINGELWGTLTNVSWCVDYSKNTYIQGLPEGCRHPSQLYEALKNLLIFGILCAVKSKKKLPKGSLFWLFILLYGILRFLITFYREDPRYWGLSTGQWLNVGMVILAGLWLWKESKRTSSNKSDLSI